jgi:four helix bundle protein
MNPIADELRARTLEYTVRTIRYCRTLPDDWIAREAGRQLLRAGMGVSGDYWSACRARSRREFIAKLAVATDESEENVLWLNAITRSEIRNDRETHLLLAEAEELRAILSTSTRTARENHRRRQKL